MRTLPAVKQILLASSIALAVAACNQTGSQQNLSQEEIQYLSSLDQARFYQKQGQLKASIDEARAALRLSPDSIEPFLVIADNMRIAGDARNAEKQYLELLESEDKLKQADSPGLYNRVVIGLATSLSMQRKTKEAREALERVESPTKEEQTEILNLRGEMAIADSDPEQARDFFTQARETSPDSVSAIISLSRLAAMEEDAERVESLIAEAESVAPNDPELWLWKGQYAESRKDFAKAEEAYVRALDDIGRYDLMIYQKYQTISRLVAVLRAQGKISEAFVYEEILAKSAPGTIKAGYETALKSYQEGKLEAAAAELEEVLVQAPNHTESGILLGMIRYNEGNLTAANELLSRHGSEAKSPAVRKVLAATKIKLQRPAEAMEVLHQIEAPQQDPEVLSLMGVASLALGDKKDGIEKIEQALALEPNNTELRVRTARYYLSLNDHQSAIEQLRHALNQNSNNDEAQLLLASAYTQAGDLKQAERHVQNWLKAKPNNPSALNALGSIAMQTGNEAQARKHFEQATKHIDSDVTPLLNLASLAARKDNWQEAERHFVSALKIAPENPHAIAGLLNVTNKINKRDEGVRILQDLISDNNKAINMRLALAELHASEGNRSDAETMLEQIEAVSPSDQRVSRLRVRIDTNAVETALKSKDFDQARKIAKEAGQRTPDSIEAQLLEARVEMAAGQADRALAVVSEAKELYGESAMPFELEGDLLAQQANLKDAVASYQQAWERQASQSLAVKMHHALRQSGQLNASLKPLQDWLSIQPNAPQAMILLAMSYQSGGEYDKAIAQYEKVKTLRPDDPVMLNNLAWLYQETGHKEALTTAQAAYEVAGDNAAIADTYGWILLQNNKITEGLAILKKAYELSPETQEIALHLAEAYEKSGKPDEALQIRSRLPDQSPEQSL